MKKQLGFTFVELMVVIAIIGILSAVVIVPLNQSTEQSRDAQRQADLRAMQTALELFKQKYGRYPEGCNNTPANATNNNAWNGNIAYWSGEPGTLYECSGGSADYILDDLSQTTEVESFVPDFIHRLPRDPRLETTDGGYVYITNPDGSVYKLMALNTVESEDVYVFTDLFTLNVEVHPLSRCGADMNENSQCRDIPTGATGGVTQTPVQCQTSNFAEWSNDYAVFGGVAPRGYSNIWRETLRAREYFTTAVQCR